MDKFTEQNIAQNEQYEQDLERTKADKADVDSQEMTAEEFVATLLMMDSGALLVSFSVGLEWIYEAIASRQDVYHVSKL